MKFVLTSGFGMIEAVRKGKPHNGLDLAMPVGTKLRSIADGVVERVVDYGSQNLGKGVIIRMEDGTRHIYGHMHDVSVKVGQKVHDGTLIGLSGNTGHSTGPHLHFGMWKDGEFQDPTPVIEEVDALAGEVSTYRFFQGNGILYDLGGSLREKAKEQSREWILGFLDALADVVVDLSYAVTLVGGGILLILHAVGFRHRWLKAPVLIVGHVLIKLLLGGY